MVERGEHERLSLRRLAKEAGVSPAAPYHHFQDRAQVLSSLATEGFEELDAALESACEGLSEPRDRLTRSCETYLRFAVEHGAHYGLMFSSDYADPVVHEAYHRAARLAFETLCGKVAAVVGESAEPHDVVERAMAIWSMAHGMAELWIDGLVPAASLDLERTAGRLGVFALAVATS